ncbi:hypothetical protein TMatcc_004025 [Talaromyces marneffei ATCC 18224]
MPRNRKYGRGCSGTNPFWHWWPALRLGHKSTFSLYALRTGAHRRPSSTFRHQRPAIRHIHLVELSE